MSLYLVCCAASGTGSASTANNVIAIAKINVLDFIHSPLLPLLTAGVRLPALEIHSVIDLLLCVALIGLTRFGTPVDAARFEARQREDRPHMTPVGAHLVQPRQAVILQAEHDPAAVGRVRTNQGLDVPTLVMRYETQVRSVWTDGRNVRRDSGGMTDSIRRKNQVLAVRRPVLVNSDAETERDELEQVAAVNVGDEERRLELLIALGDEAEFLAVGRNIRVGCAGRGRDPLPIVAGEIHAPKRLLVGCGIEPMEHDPRPVRRERRITLADICVWGQLNDVAAVGVHQGDAAEGRFFPPVNLEDDLPTVR